MELAIRLKISILSPFLNCSESKMIQCIKSDCKCNGCHFLSEKRFREGLRPPRCGCR